MAKERTILKSVGFPESLLDGAEELQELEGGSFAEHVRIALREYLIKKKVIKE
ncbi:MAG: hypothetical protein J6V44_09080 [Methanobrevibacter sp.]|nr:hypothetical protein [Methanobrevibacter sp.]